MIAEAIQDDEDDESRGGRLVWDPTCLEEPAVDAYLTSTRLDGEWGFYDQNRAPLSPDHTAVAPVEMVMLTLCRHNYDVATATAEFDQLGLKWHPCRPDLTHWTEGEMEIFESAIGRVEYKEELNFAEIQRAVKTKNYHEVVEFYWYWKKALRRRPRLILEDDVEDTLNSLERKRKRAADEVDWDLISAVRPGAMDPSVLQSRVPASNALPSLPRIHDDDLLSPPKRRKYGSFDGGDMPPLFADASSNPAVSAAGVGEVDMSANDTPALDTCDLPADVYSMFDVESDGRRVRD